MYLWQFLWAASWVFPLLFDYSFSWYSFTSCVELDLEFFAIFCINLPRNTVIFHCFVIYLYLPHHSSFTYITKWWYKVILRFCQLEHGFGHQQGTTKSKLGTICQYFFFIHASVCSQTWSLLNLYLTYLQSS
jgi:hypothetical protein